MVENAFHGIDGGILGDFASYIFYIAIYIFISLSSLCLDFKKCNP